MRHKVGDWVYTSLGRCPRLFKCKVVAVKEREESFLWAKWKEPYYVLQIPGQSWVFEGNDNAASGLYAAASEGEFYSR